jgi:hypothetical protein
MLVALAACASLFFFFQAAQVWAAEEEKKNKESPAAEESPVSGAVEFTGSRDSGVWLYAERKVAKNWAVSLSAAQYQKGFQEITFGPTYYIFPEMQVGVSLGVARYTSKDDSRLSVSSFWYWKTDSLETEVVLERYGGHDPYLYYRIYAQTPISKKLVVGVYGEQGIGWGPRIIWPLNENIKLWLTPLVERSGGNVIAGGIQFLF